MNTVAATKQDFLFNVRLYRIYIEAHVCVLYIYMRIRRLQAV